ncbi:MAG: PSD1 domain-containing protein, partial [Bryobacterales bacterium]|nr:PSD1 domain-containing protein [Bryobacterales bacterium]
MRSRFQAPACRLLAISTLLLVSVAGVARAQEATVDFARDVQPVLTAKCLACHSGVTAQAELKLHTRADLLKGGLNGPAIVAGDGANSLLVRKIDGQQGMRMPPAGPALSPETISLIRAWIDEGAKYEGVLGTVDRLAPMAPRTPALPPGNTAHPVDRFVDAYLLTKGIAATEPVSDGHFARRVYFDVLGIPPNPVQLQAFTKSRNQKKRDALVDALLADREGYADHWMSFWNDLLRNDEGVIYHGERKSITVWLHEALASNKPYDAMVRELLDPSRNNAAAGYLTGVTWRGVVSASQTPPMQASQNAAQVFLGMNLKCAACHDSFVNRWKLADTFGLAAMFADEELELVRCDVKTGRMAEAKFPVDDLGVQFGSSLASRRGAAATWFTHPKNGRFARTIVNRYWKLLLGRGLVEPIDDMDAEAWNQDLLDWLASDFADHGFDLQRLLRTILTSRAYQMRAVGDVAADEAYVFRGPQLRRLSAEQFQDTISAVSGDWRVNQPRADVYARYTREWRLKSDPLSRALGRPIRDQVYTERGPEASTLQALELTNGPLLAKRLQNAARALLGQRKPSPANRFDSRMMRGGAANIDIEIAGASELWLLVQDVDSYDPDRVATGWANAHVVV